MTKTNPRHRDTLRLLKLERDMQEHFRTTAGMRPMPTAALSSDREPDHAAG
jgi:hypothetical protein